MDPVPFSEAFRKWVLGLRLKTAREIINIDGKTSRGSRDGKGTVFHLLSAFASGAGIVPGHKTGSNGEKSGEIPALPQPINVLSCKGSAITVDAMGRQKAVTEKIISKKADYVFVLKGNQRGMHKIVKTIFSKKTGKSF